MHKRRCFQQAVMPARIEPGESSAHLFYLKLTLLEVRGNEVGDLQLPSPGGLEVNGDIDAVLAFQANETLVVWVRLGVEAGAGVGVGIDPSVAENDVNP